MGRKRFPIWRRSNPEDFEFIADPVLDVQELPVRCALLSRILFWKNITLQTAYLVAMATLVGAGVLLFVNWLAMIADRLQCMLWHMSPPIMHPRVVMCFSVT